MKTLTITIAFSFFNIISLLAQQCHQINITNPKEQQIILDFIHECIRDHHFIGDKGVVTVKRFINEDKQPAWVIRAELDDKYRDNPPKEWALLGEDIILFYDGKSQFDIEKTAPTPDMLKCLEEAIGDRLYIRPLKTQRWIEMVKQDGSKEQVKVNRGRIIGGGPNNSKIIHFDADGKVRILKSV
ncbi:hypothetical protein [Arsenicibacter rosenii]|uniref:Beta-lactamase-inhibitor-like PepSY-like domain-containing protein n=1 Tax=Arsenicibacter rosenii TaxID=1750698 RepID=A0A1S2VNK2_9BACT|nr:hypothetical protein [Arsenicibacter rosenii]OIN60339.1 hypothetical protein BLX24_05800 [Arsenicibacter rosenii]